MGKPIRVLVVDDSALVRSLLTTGLQADGDIVVIGAVPDPYIARDFLVREKPDVLTLDVEMPRMNGIDFLRKFMGIMPTPTIVLSSLTARGSALAVEALSAGAVSVFCKPTSQLSAALPAMFAELRAAVRAARTAQVHKLSYQRSLDQIAGPVLETTTEKIIGLGASTGGVAALGRILPAFPPACHGIVIVQHMPAGFTRDFAERLNQLCAMRVAEAKDGDRVIAGRILVAPGGEQHLRIVQVGGEYKVRLEAGDYISGHRPSVDAFFSSLALAAGANAAGCLLTGMGDDGAAGLLAMRAAGGHTFAQDEASSAVYGMPAAAMRNGGASTVLPLDKVPSALLSLWRGRG